MSAGRSKRSKPHAGRGFACGRRDCRRRKKPTAKPDPGKATATVAFDEQRWYHPLVGKDNRAAWAVFCFTA